MTLRPSDDGARGEGARGEGARGVGARVVAKTPRPGAGTGASAPAEVEMRGIVKHFPGVRANDGIDLTVAPGEIHALMGENGAGKSTLMSILYGMQRPDAGTILIGGREVSFT